MILGLKNRGGEVINQKLELKYICFHFYSKLYKGQQILEKAIIEVFDSFLTSFTEDMNAELIKPFTVLEFFNAIKRMVDGKALEHDGILVEFFKKS